ncbi:MAG: TetR/AcrR family transcriptional regulator [Tessaracoccus sp.]|uniref:TetR/AcrR family transcriptional regulator n=1 Tax=Tessaracoccus sp. TaxID=1971211 RepID=UPI001ED567A8|nr:TetR/AcrR family transcriptional regulator [Tessaracoccus sp.]MBK7820792.1 TetR/AcrR family transcriptional regulator [Tessaracoccus sp.]
MTSSTEGKRGPYAKTEQFRLDVLDAALGLVAAHGLDAATLQLIADEVGRSKAGLLHHFGSRDALLLAIVEHRDAVNHRSFPVEPGFAGSTKLVAHNATVPGLIALFAVMSALAAADPEPTSRRDYFVARYARTRAGFVRQVEAAQQAGTARADLPAEQVATLIVATMDGLQIQWLLDPDIDMTTHLEALIRLLSA